MDSGCETCGYISCRCVDDEEDEETMLEQKIEEVLCDVAMPLMNEATAKFGVNYIIPKRERELIASIIANEVRKEVLKTKIDMVKEAKDSNSSDGEYLDESLNELISELENLDK